MSLYRTLSPQLVGMYDFYRRKWTIDLCQLCSSWTRWSTIRECLRDPHPLDMKSRRRYTPYHILDLCAALRRNRLWCMPWLEHDLCQRERSVQLHHPCRHQWCNPSITSQLGRPLRYRFGIRRRLKLELITLAG